MSLKVIYLRVLLLFCLSVPAAINMDTIVFRLRGYDEEVASGSGKTEEARERMHAAFEKEGPRIAMTVKAIMMFWIAMFVFSVTLIKIGVSVPFKLLYVGAVLSGLLTLVAVVPVLLFGKGLPPRPF